MGKTMVFQRFWLLGASLGALFEALWALLEALWALLEALQALLEALSMPKKH